MNLVQHALQRIQKKAQDIFQSRPVNSIGQSRPNIPQAQPINFRQVANKVYNTNFIPGQVNPIHTVLNDVGKNFNNYNIYAQMAHPDNNPNFQLVNKIPVLNQASRLGGAYIQNRAVNPLGSIRPGVQTALNPKLSAKQRLMGAGGAGLNALQAGMFVAPGGQGLNLGFSTYQGLKVGDFGLNKNASVGQRANSFAQGFVGNQDKGLGSALTKNKKLATAGNLAELPLTVLATRGHANSAGIQDAKVLAQKAKSLDEFSKLLGQAKQPTKDAVLAIFKDERSPINNAQDFYNIVKGIKPVVKGDEGLKFRNALLDSGKDKIPGFVQDPNNPRRFTLDRIDQAIQNAKDSIKAPGLTTKLISKAEHDIMANKPSKIKGGIAGDINGTGFNGGIAGDANAGLSDVETNLKKKYGTGKILDADASVMTTDGSIVPMKGEDAHYNIFGKNDGAFSDYLFGGGIRIRKGKSANYPQINVEINKTPTAQQVSALEKNLPDNMDIVFDMRGGNGETASSDVLHMSKEHFLDTLRKHYSLPNVAPQPPLTKAELSDVAGQSGKITNVKPKIIKILNNSNTGQLAEGNQSSFFAVADKFAKESDHAEYGGKQIAKYVDESKLYKDSSSYNFLDKRGILDKPDPQIQKQYGYKTLRDLWNNSGELRDPNVVYRELQTRAKAILQKEGYPGASWSYEDDLTPHQVQVWDKSVLLDKGVQQPISDVKPKELKIKGNVAQQIDNEINGRATSLRAKGRNSYTNVKAIDDPIGNPEPLPWEQQKDVVAQSMGIKPFNQKEIDTAILDDLTNKRSLMGRVNPINDLSPDLKDAFTKHFADTNEAQAIANKVAYDFKSGLDPELEYRLVKYSQNPTEETAAQLNLTPEDLSAGEKIIAKSRKFNDDIFKRAQAEGIDLNYLKNHIIQAFKETPGEIDNKLRAKGLGQKPGFANQRQIESFQQGEEFGLNPKYTTFGQLNALAEHELQKARANKALFQKLIDSGKILPANTPNLPSDWVNIDAPFFPQAARRVGEEQTVITGYKAPPQMARVIHNIFGTESQSLGSTLLRGAAKVSGVMQDVALSGGVGPLNFYGLGQLIKEATAGRVSRPVAAFMRSFSGTLSKNYEISNAKIIQEMASQGIKPRGIGNYQTLYKNAKVGKTIGELIGGTWNKIINEPTFGRFQNQLQVSFYKDTKQALINGGRSPKEAITLAAKATKNFYGIGNQVGRSMDLDHLISTVFLAPKYRESMINIFKNMGMGVLDPRQWGKPEYAGVQRLAAGMAITYGMYNVAQVRLTGKPMWENPPGKELELVIPVGDPKDKKYVSIPFMPGFTALPRRVLGTAGALAKGDVPEAGKQFSSLFSIPVGKIGELASNSDYFGNPIYGKDVPLKQTLAYGVGSFAPGYGRAALDVATGRATPAFGAAEALELPLRKGTFPNPYFAARDEALASLTPEERKQADFLLTADKKGGPSSEMEANMMLGNPNLMSAKKKIALATNPNDPLWSRSDGDIRAFLAYRALADDNGDDTKKKAQLRIQYPWIPQVQFQNANSLYESQQAKSTPTPGYDPNSLQGKLGALLNPAKPVDTSSNIDKPRINPMQMLSEDQVKIVSAYTAAEKGSPARKQLLAANPWLKAYWDANAQFYQENPIKAKGPLADFLESIGIDPNSASSNSGFGYGYKKGNGGSVKKSVKKVAAKKQKAIKLSGLKGKGKAKLLSVRLNSPKPLKKPKVKKLLAKQPKKLKLKTS